MAARDGTDKFVLLFNCFCRAPVDLSGRHHTDMLLGTTFELDETWPQHVRCAHLVDYRKLTIALAPGYGADDRSANVMVNVLAVVHTSATFNTLTPLRRSNCRFGSQRLASQQCCVGEEQCHTSRLAHLVSNAFALHRRAGDFERHVQTYHGSSRKCSRGAQSRNSKTCTDTAVRLQRQSHSK